MPNLRRQNIRVRAAKAGLFMIAAAAVCLAGCGPAGRGTGHLLGYEFKDRGLYRVECQYDWVKRTVKSHAGRVFAESSDSLYTKSAFLLHIRPQAQGAWAAEFTLERLRIHDGAGHFRFEIGPKGGSLGWYRDEQPLAGYLGETFPDFLRLMRRPLAVVAGGRSGAADSGTTGTASGVEMSREWLGLWTRNRVLDGYILRGFKVPPLFAVVLSREPVRPGQTWQFQGSQAQTPGFADQPLVTRFVLKRVQGDSAEIAFDGRLELSGDELQRLRRTLQLDEMAGLSFEGSRFDVSGEMQFNLPAGRPNAGRLQFRKSYRLSVADEHWQVDEDHAYTLQVQPRGE